MFHAVSLLLAFVAPLQTPEATAKIAPFVSDEMSAVAHVDLAGWDAQASLRKVLGKLADEEGLPEATKTAAGWVEGLKDAGAKDLYVLVDLTVMPALPMAVVPLEEGADAEKIMKYLREGTPDVPLKWPAAEAIRGVVVAGRPADIARLKAAKPTARPEFAEALSAFPKSRIQVAILPSATQRRVLEEALPTLPPQFGGGPIGTLTQGMRWAALGMTFEPKPVVQAVVQGKDADAAKAIQKLAVDALKTLAAGLKGDPTLAPLSEAVGRMKPAAEGDRVTLDADLEKTTELVSIPVRQARENARRSQCVNNLKQIGLAMHNYHNKHDSFPPAFTTSKEGKPLLSWRVLILPYLEQQELYKEFHLDEAWDSPHNKALISRMPAIYACPSGKKTTIADGKTSYLTARGPSTMFPGTTGIKIQEITDGTSNTIMAFDANDESAVIWTAPDDWTMPEPFAAKGLFGHHPRGTNFLYGDGSVRFIKETVDLKILHFLFTRNGGEVIDADAY